MGIKSFVGDKVSDATDYVSDKVEDGADYVSDKVEDGAEYVSDKVSDVGEFFASKAEDIADGVGDVLGDIWDGVTNLADRVTGWLGGLVSDIIGSIVDQVMAAFDNVRSIIEDIVGAARDLFRGVMAPKTLADRAQDWREGPVKALTGLEQSISETALTANDNWKSSAGASYAGNIPPQGQAVTAMAKLGEQTAVALTDASKALETFYAESLGTVGRLYAAVNGNPGSLFSLGSLMDVLGGGAGTLFARIKAIADLATEVKRIQDDLADNVTQSGAFPDGQWPRAVMF